MIESNIIKRFIVKTFMQSSEADVPRVAEKVMSSLSSRFILNEYVVVPSRNLEGKVCGRVGAMYKIATSDTVVEVPFEEMSRRFKVGFGDICYFLECVTVATPLGRIVIENVFDRITQPEFGGRASMEHQSSPQRGSSKYAQAPARSLSQDADASLSGDKSLMPSARPESQKLDLSILKPYSLHGVDEKDLASIIRIYTFFSTFGESLKMEKFSVEEMVEALKDPEYSSEIAFGMHASLVGMIEKDINAQSSRLLGELSMLVEDLPVFQAVAPISQARKQVPIDAENWKSRTKAFVQDLSRDLDSDRVLRFVDFAKKDFALRVEFIGFLLDAASFTESVREFVSSSQSQIRAEKSKADQLQLLRRRTDGETKAELERLAVELGSMSLRNLSNPLRAHIGRYKDYVLMLVDGSIVLKDKLKFYLLGSAEARAVLADLDTNSRTEKITSANLGGVVDVLFTS